MCKYGIGDILIFAQVKDRPPDYAIILDNRDEVYTIQYVDSAYNHVYSMNYIDSNPHITLAA